MSELEIENKIKYHKNEIKFHKKELKNYEQLRDENKIHSYSKRSKNASEILRYVKEKRPTLLHYYEKIMDSYKVAGIKSDNFNLFYGQIWAMRGNYTEDIVEFKQPLFTLLKSQVDKNRAVQVSFYKNAIPTYNFDGCYGITEHF